MLIFSGLVIFAFSVGVISFEIDLIQNHNHFRTQEVLIFERCEKDYKTIIINDDSENLDLMWLQQLHNYTVIVWKKCIRYNKNCFNAKKIDAILITASSSTRLREILESMYDNIWWDAMTPVYILNLPKNSCNFTKKSLQYMWKYDILVAYYLCIKDREVKIYTHNPFTNRAPSSWKKMKKSSKESNWTLYGRTYHPQTICEGLDFDRTKSLDGFPITIALSANTEKGRKLIGKYIDYNNLSHYGIITTIRHSQSILDALFMKLNVHLRFFVMKESYNDGEINYINYIANISKDGDLDLVLNNFHLPKKNMKIGRLTRTYPLAWKVNGIATRNRGYRTLAEKVWDFYGIWTISYTIFILLITFLVIWVCESRRTAFAVFEIIRLLTSHSLYTRMNTLPLRIFFIAILIYFLIIQATFNGHLANFLTKPELRKHAETREDLRNLGYQIYDSKYVKEYLAETEKEKAVYLSRVKKCLEHIVHNDQPIACVFDSQLLRIYSRKVSNNFYISKRSTGTLYSTVFMKDHWSLSKLVNMAIMSLEELGFRQRISGHWEHKLNHNSIVAEARLKKDFQPIKLENLIFAFSILAIGLISATLSFCAEILMTYKSKCNAIPILKSIKTKTKIMNRIKIKRNFRRKKGNK